MSALLVLPLCGIWWCLIDLVAAQRRIADAMGAPEQPSSKMKQRPERP